MRVVKIVNIDSSHVCKNGGSLLMLVLLKILAHLCTTMSLIAINVNAANMTAKRDFGGLDKGDDQAALLNPGNKLLTQIVQDDSFREFEFRQYLFSCQSKVCNSLLI